MVKQNVGTLDAYLRIMGGLLSLGYGISRFSRRPDGIGVLCMAAGAMKAAEGITRFCPMLYALGISTVEKENHPASVQETIHATDQETIHIQQGERIIQHV